MNHFRMVFYIRSIFEPDRYNSSKIYAITYSFLSKILHKCDYTEILKFLESKKITENEILEFIKNRINVTLGQLSQDYVNQINQHELSDIERVFLPRDKGDISAEAKCELDNIVHLNSAYAISLNPFKLNY